MYFPIFRGGVVFFQLFSLKTQTIFIEDEKKKHKQHQNYEFFKLNLAPYSLQNDTDLPNRHQKKLRLFYALNWVILLQTHRWNYIPFSNFFVE